MQKNGKKEDDDDDDGDDEAADAHEPIVRVGVGNPNGKVNSE